MVVIGISVAFFDTFYCVVAWEAITNVAVVDSKRTLDLYLLKVRVVIYCILSLPKVLLDCCNKYFIVFCHVTLRKLPSYYSYYIKFQIFSWIQDECIFLFYAKYLMNSKANGTGCV